MKKLFLLALLVALGYGTYKFLESVKNTTATGGGATKRSEKALKDMDKDVKQ